MGWENSIDEKMRKAFGWGYLEVWKCGKWAVIDERTCGEETGSTRLAWSRPGMQRDLRLQDWSLNLTFYEKSLKTAEQERTLMQIDGKRLNLEKESYHRHGRTNRIQWMGHDDVEGWLRKWLF